MKSVTEFYIKNLVYEKGRYVQSKQKKGNSKYKDINQLNRKQKV